MTEPPIRILIADDEEVIRGALADFFSSDERFEVLPTAIDAATAAALAAEHLPDVALLDVRMPGGGGPEAARAIRACSPRTRVVALSAHEDRDTVMQMLGNGAIAYVVKGSNPNAIIEAALNAAAGMGTLSPEVATGIVDAVTAQRRLSTDALAQRQAKVDRIGAAIRGEGLSMVYQPIWDLRAQTLAGYEALARFRGPPVRTPDLWFTEAFEYGQGPALEIAAVRLALTTAGSRLGTGFLAVNMSPDTITHGGLGHLDGLGEVGRIVVEITEHAPIVDYKSVSTLLAAFQERGLRLAIDDAGSGYASFRHILSLDPQMIKLDVSLTAGIDHDSKRRALAAALIAFAATMEVEVVAEGIENFAELNVLTELGASHGQGYLLGRPQPIEIIEAGESRWPQAA